MPANPAALQEAAKTVAEAKKILKNRKLPWLNLYQNGPVCFTPVPLLTRTMNNYKPIIDRINTFITEDYDGHCQVMSGVLSDALYFFYYGLHYNNQEMLDRAYRIVDYHIETANDYVLNFKFAHGLPGIAWLTQFLVNKKLLPAECTGDLHEIDAAIDKTIEWDRQDHVYDLTVGSIGKGLYYFERGAAEHQPVIERILNILHQTAVYTPDDACAWLDHYTSPHYKSPRKRTSYYNLGLGHGHASIVYFLCLCYRHGINRPLCEQLITGAIRWLQQHKLNAQWPYVLPNLVFRDGETNDDFTQGWCHGLVSNATALYFAGKTLQNEQWLQEFRDIIALSRKIICIDPNYPTLKITGGYGIDLSLCHGVASFVYLYEKIYRQTSWPECREASDYWTALLESSLTEDVLFHHRRHGLLGGLPGIAISFMSREAGEHTAFNWDRILLFDIENL
jgi:tetratricopeptide (TPR) repeat protein